MIKLNIIKKNITFLVIFFILIATFVSCLSGTVKNESRVTIYKDGCCEGYTLVNTIFFFNKIDKPYAALVDMEGNEIHKWENINPMIGCILPGGDIIGIDPVAEDIIQLDWNGNMIWNFSGWDDTKIGINHDYQREGNPVSYYAPNQNFSENGNTLILSYRWTYNPDISTKTLEEDVIFEVDWNGNMTGFIWNSTDHFEEFGFDWKAKHGIKYFPGIVKPLFGLFCPDEFLHLNTLKVLGENKWYDKGDERFNPENIIITSRNANIIAIISKETGEIVWKVGPDYSRDTEDGKKLGQIIGPHHSHIIPKGLPGAGNVLIFDNGGVAGYGYFGCPNRYRPYSRIIEFNPITLEIVWEYHHKSGLPFPFTRNGENHRFYSWIISSAQRLPNGNTLVTEGKNSRIFEINTDNEIVWDYLIEHPIPRHMAYRALRIPPEWIPENPANYSSWKDLYNDEI